MLTFTKLQLVENCKTKSALYYFFYFKMIIIIVLIIQCKLWF